MKYIFLVLTIIIFSCESKTSDSTKTKGEKDGIVKSYSKDGTLLSEINYKNGVREGLGKSYYKNGNLQFLIPYSGGKRQGIVKKYYASGRIYQETEFVSDKKTGLQKTYEENGKLRSEAIFDDGEPCLGLKEYLLDGSQKKKYPTIVTKIEDKVKSSGEYKIYLSLDNGSEKVKFYRGELTKKGCLSNRLVPLPYNKKLKRSELRYTIPVGTFLMEEVNVVAEVTTLAGNSYLIRKVINVAIDN